MAISMELFPLNLFLQEWYIRKFGKISKMSLLKFGCLTETLMVHYSTLEYIGQKKIQEVFSLMKLKKIPLNIGRIYTKIKCLNRNGTDLEFLWTISKQINYSNQVQIME